MKAHFILTDNQILLYKGDQMYNAYEKDIAVVNLYFGDSTAFGETKLNVIFVVYLYLFSSLRVREISKNDLA